MVAWKESLNNFFEGLEQQAKVTAEKQKQAQSDAEKFIQSIVVPALEELKLELEKHRQVTVSSNVNSATLVINHKGEEEFRYIIQIEGTRVQPITHQRDKNDGRMFSAQGPPIGGTSDVTREQIISGFLGDYMRHIAAVHRA